MGEFAALEVKVETIWWRDRDTAIGDGGGGDGSGVGEGQSVVFRLHFILYVEDERDDRGAGRSWENGERGTLNYNPLRDTAEFAFKIKRTQVVPLCSV